MAERACPACEADPHPRGFAQPRKCAWPGPDFDPANWNCATMNLVRQVAEDAGVTFRGDDQTLCVLDGEAGWLVLCWYKRRGRTSVCLWVDDEQARPLRLEDAEHIVGFDQ